MLPTLSLGPVTVYTIGPTLLVGFVIATFAAWKKLVEARFDEEEAVGFLLWASLAAFVLARVAYILIHSADFGLFPLRWILFTRYAGFSFWGALAGVILAGRYFAKTRGWDFFALTDATVFGGVIFQIFTQIGCFADGCFLGRPTTFITGLPFPGQEGRLHPVQLYELFGLLLIFFFLWRIELRWRTFSWYKSQAAGFLFLVWAMFYFLVRFVVGFFGQSDLYLGPVSPDQLVSLALAVVSGVALYLRSGRDWRGDLRLARVSRFPLRYKSEEDKEEL